MILWFWVAATAFGHGGPPESNALLWDASSQMTVASSHGLIFEDGGWDWVCDEVTGTSLPIDLNRTSQALLVATTSGLAWTETGCDWTWVAELAGDVVWDLDSDLGDPDRVWAATGEGLWWSDDHGASFSFHGTPDPMASVRSFVPMPGGGFTVLGFLEGQAIAWLSQEDGWLATVLPVNGGHLIALGTDTEGNVYGRFPMPSGTDELLRIEPDASVHSVLQTDYSIGAFLSNDEGLLVSVDRLGNLVSTNHGDTWTLNDELTFDCLVTHNDRIWGCPADESETLWVYTDGSILDAAADWIQGPEFVDLSGPRCPDSLPECSAIWPDVATELRIDPLDADDTSDPLRTSPDASIGGCGSRAAVFVLPWGLLWSRRNRTEHRDQTRYI